MAHWRDHYARLPKLAILTGTTLVGAVAGPAGAVTGFLAGLFIDRHVRGGDLWPHFGDDPGDATGKPAAPTLGPGGRVPTQADWEAFLAKHPIWKKKPGRPAPPKPGAPRPMTPTGQGGTDTFSQAASVIQTGANVAQGVAGAVGDVVNALASGDFGIGTVIPSSGLLKTFVLADPSSGAQPIVQGRDIQDAAKNAVKRFYPNASTVVRIIGTNTFQTDNGDTFQLVAK
jgi:hypothetical protein